MGAIRSIALGVQSEMEWLGLHALFLVGLATALPTAVIMLAQRRSAQSALGWLIALLAIPYIALPMFWVLGFRKRRAGYPKLAFQRSGAQEGDRCVEATTFERLGTAGTRSGGSLTLLTTGDEAWAALTKLVEGERRTLDAMFYLVADDTVGRAFLDLLTQRAGSGVRVRLMIDRLGSFPPPNAALDRFKAAGGTFRYIAPILHKPTETRLNLRNHRKLLIAGGHTAYSGGRNVGADYLGPGSDRHRFVDLASILKGPGVLDYATVFASDWAAAGGASAAMHPGTAPPPIGNATTLLVPSGPDMADDALHDGLISAIHRADRRIWLTSPYVAPPEPLMDALRLAARRGVDVRLLGPRSSNHTIADFARGAYLRDLADQGARLLFHETRMVHAKAGLIDDLAWVGSANLDNRSMLLNFELVLFVTSPGERDAIAKWFEALEKCCGTGLPPASRARLFAERLFRLGTPLI